MFLVAVSQVRARHGYRVIPDPQLDHLLQLKVPVALRLWSTGIWDANRARYLAPGILATSLDLQRSTRVRLHGSSPPLSWGVSAVLSFG
jgi:hypothetical protein